MTAESDGPQTILAFDYGRRRIGVAIGQSGTQHTGPLTTIRVGGCGPDWSKIEQQLSEWQPSLLIVGLPYNMDGTDNELTPCVKKFARQLKGRFGLPVEMVDERLTSVEARNRLRERRREGTRGKRVTREDIDRIAALVILESWLNRPGRKT